MPSQLRILKINFSQKKKKKTHEFRSIILFIKNTKEHKPKKNHTNPENQT